MTENTNKNKDVRPQEKGNAIVIILVVLVIVAVGALAYLSGQMAAQKGSSTDTQEMASAASPKSAVQTAEAGANDGTNDIQPSSGQAQAAEASAPAQPEINIEPGNPVVGRVNGEDITRLEVLQFMQQLPEQLRQLPVNQVFPMALEQTINSRLIDARVPEAESELTSSEDVQNQIENAKIQILRNAYIDQKITEGITEEAMREAYDNYVQNFQRTEEINADHILVEDEQTARNLIAQLEDGADFAELARENSTDPTAENGGDLGYFAKSEVVPEFANAAFDLEQGEFTTEPVQTEFGYHIIKLEDRRMREPQPYEDVKASIETALRRQKLEEIVTEMRENAEIVRYDINGDPVPEQEEGADQSQDG